MAKKLNVIFYAFALTFAISIAPSLAAGEGFVITQTTTPFNFADIGNNTTGGPQYWTSAANYTLWANIQNSGGDGDGTAGSYDLIFNVTFIMPYGINPANQGACNSTAFVNATIANKNGTINSTHVACTVGPFNITTGGNQLNITLNVTPNISAMSMGTLYQTAADGGGTRAPALIYAVVNSSNNTSQINTSLISPTTQHNTTSFWVNPRPYGHTVTGTYNATLYITKWDQTDPFYVMNVPLMKYNASKGRPDPAEDSFAEILYMNSTIMEKPGYMRLFSYNLTFKFVFPTTVNVGEGNYPAFNITSPVVANASYDNETLMPLLIQNMTAFSPEGNFSMVMGIPSQLGFTIWHNNTSGGGLGAYYTIGQMLGTFGIGLSYNPTSQQLLVNFTTNASANWANNTEFSILLTLMNGTSGTSSPIYVQRQILGGGMTPDSPPPLGANVTVFNFINISNALANYTLRDVRIRFMMPINVTTNISGTFNLTNLANTSARFFNYATHDWNNSFFGFLNTTVNVNLTDNLPGSPAKGANISIWFMYADLNITNGTFSNWLPKSLGNSTINFSVYMNFPTMNETPIPDGSSSGSKNYTAQIQMTMQGRVNLTDKVPGLNNNTGDAVVILDGQTLAANSGNYTLGSLTLDNVGSGTHSVQVTYSVPYSNPTAGGTAAGGGGGAAGAVVQNVVSEDNPSATVSFNVGEAATFSIPVETTGGGAAGGGGESESHSITVDSITGGVVTVTIKSDPIKLQLQVNKPEYIDVNGDGSNDIIVTVLEILSQTAARIKIDYIAKPIKKVAAPKAAVPTPEAAAPTPPAVPSLPTPEVAEEAEQPAEGLPSMAVLLVIIVVIAVIGLGFYHFKNK